MVGVGVIVERAADNVMVTGALLACVVGRGVVADALMACMAVMGAPLSREENQVLADAAAGGKFTDKMSLPGRRGLVPLVLSCQTCSQSCTNCCSQAQNDCYAQYPHGFRSALTFCLRLIRLIRLI